jgi:hypothetical protein
MKRNDKQVKIRVKYCGGCNPNYDRPALVKRIKERLGNRLALAEAGDDGISLVLAVVGCATACADLAPFRGLEVRIITCLADAELFIHDLEASDS